MKTTTTIRQSSFLGCLVRPRRDCVCSRALRKPPLCRELKLETHFPSCEFCCCTVPASVTIGSNSE
jgi:hypothetical protein